MLAIYLSPIYILVNLYMFRWLIRWMGACHHWFQKKWMRVGAAGVYFFMAFSLLIGFLLPAGQLQRFFKSLGNYWLGVLLYAILAVVVADLIRLILRRVKRIDQNKLRSRRTLALGGGIALAIIAVVSIWGVINARIIRTTEYEITVAKDGGNLNELKVVLLADLHLGYNIGCQQMEQMTEKVNAQNPDLVVIAGDIFDNEYEALDDPDRLISILKGIQSKYGVYACYGNHDIQEKILAGFTFGSKDEKKVSDPRMDEFLEKAGITLLQDEGLLIDDSFYLYGRPDEKRPGRGITKRAEPEEITEDMDQEKPIIVIDHEPSELGELSKAGVDVDLCGHTHDGQMFPGNLTIDLLWENAYGYLKKGDMHNIVTSGVGLFGPNMRVGTKAEICSITIQFEAA